MGGGLEAGAAGAATPPSPPQTCLVTPCLPPLSADWSIEALSLGTVVTGHLSYPQVVQELCGRGGALLLQLSLVFRCAGLMIVYCIISADVLAGHEGAPGLVCDLLGGGGGSGRGGWCANRQLMAGLVAVACMAPLITPKRLASTAITSW